MPGNVCFDWSFQPRKKPPQSSFYQPAVVFLSPQNSKGFRGLVLPVIFHPGFGVDLELYSMKRVTNHFRSLPGSEDRRRLGPARSRAHCRARLRAQRLLQRKWRQLHGRRLPRLPVEGD